MVLDGNVISSRSSQGAITAGSAQITGRLHPGPGDQAGQPAQLRRAAADVHQGVGPVDLAALGSDQLHAGLIAGGIGLLLVVLYCLLYYRGLAVVAVSSLIIAAVLVFELVILLGKYQGFALELSGRGRPHRGHRHHRGLVRGVLRATA